MPGQEYDVILTGEVLSGFDHDRVVAGLAQLFRIQPGKAGSLLNKKPRKIKSGISKEKAHIYVIHLRNIGAACVPVPSHVAGAKSQSAAAATPGASPDAHVHNMAEQAVAATTADSATQKQEQAETTPIAPAAVEGGPSLADQQAQAGSMTTPQPDSRNLTEQAVAAHVAGFATLAQAPTDAKPNLSGDVVTENEPVLVERQTQGSLGLEQRVELDAGTVAGGGLADVTQEQSDAAALVNNTNTAKPPPGGDAVTETQTPRKKIKGKGQVAGAGTKGVSVESLREVFRRGAGDVNPQIEPVESSPLLAVLTLGLPIVYLALLFGMAALTLLHVSSNAVWLTQEPRWLYLALYLAIIFFGTALVLVMVKPLAQGFLEPIARKPVNLDKHPLLSVFIKEIAHIVDAPVPRRVNLVMHPAVSVQPINGVRGLRKGELNLDLGLPLLAGCSMSQLAGIVANELAYYTQHPQQFSQNVILRVNNWFHRCVHHRDHWDESLASWKGALSGKVSWIIGLLQLGIWLGRYVLLLFFRCSALLNSRISRQAVYAADRYQCAVSGSDQFVASLSRLLELEIGFYTASDKVHTENDAHKLCADMVNSILRIADTLAEDDRSFIADTLQQKNSAANELHPLEGERIDAILAKPQAGLMHWDKPAKLLVKDFAAFCRQVTVNYYEEECGLKVVLEELLDTGASGLNETAVAPATAHAELEHYLAGLFHPDRVLTPKLHSADTITESELKAAVAQIIADLRPKIPVYQESLMKHENLLKRLATVYNGKVFVNNRIPFNPEHYGLSDDLDDTAGSAYLNTQAELQQVEARLREIEKLISQRMGMELSLLMHNSASAGGNMEEVPGLLLVLQTFAQAEESLQRMFVHASTLEDLVKTISGGKDISDAILDQDIQLCLNDYEKILNLFEHVAHPFDTHPEKRTIRQVIEESAGELDSLRLQFNQIPAAFYKTRDIFRDLNRDIMERLSEYTQTMEDAMHLAHLDPKADDKQAVNA